MLLLILTNSTLQILALKSTQDLLAADMDDHFHFTAQVTAKKTPKPTSLTHC